MTKKTPMRDQSLHRNLLYNISGLTLITKQTEWMTKQMTTTTDHTVEVHHETTTIIKTTLHNTDSVLHHETEITLAVVLHLILTLVHVMIIINETLDRIVLIDHTDDLSDAILLLDTSPVLV